MVPDDAARPKVTVYRMGYVALVLYLNVRRAVFHVGCREIFADDTAHANVQRTGRMTEIYRAVKAAVRKLAEHSILTDRASHVQINLSRAGICAHVSVDQTRNGATADRSVVCPDDTAHVEVVLAAFDIHRHV